MLAGSGADATLAFLLGLDLGANADLSGGNGLDESEELPKEGEEGWKKV
jgi:hypothetical protein